MKTYFVRATKYDVYKLIEIHNKAFYEDYIKYGECPGYNRTYASMYKSVTQLFAYIIMCGNQPVGDIIFRDNHDGGFYIGSLCIIPKYQGMGLGTKALQFVFEEYSNVKKWTLKTPMDKQRNLRFYESCGFKITGYFMDGNVKVAMLENSSL